MKRDPNKRLLRRPRYLYVRYLWAHGLYRDLVQHVGQRVNTLLLACAWAWIPCFVLVTLLVVLCKPLASGTNEAFIVREMVRQISIEMDAYLAAYQDVSRLAGKVQRIGQQPEDRAFVYAFLITKYAREFGFKPEEVAGLIMTESEFNTTARSKKDAHGLMQIHRPAWGEGDWYNPEVNIQKGVRILYMYRNTYPSSYLRKYGGWVEGGEGYVRTVRANQRLFH